ncbi:hypothetical protein BDF19DRAFT_423124 [Syncephalis fuscata]|nr:hypothetical protein BDF19DRAFT_423124 [Syncephalis fuscata]
MHYFHIFIASVLLAHAAAGLTAAIVERNGDKPKIEPFVATDEFKVIEEGQDIPPSKSLCQIRYDYGQRMAKLMPKETPKPSANQYDLTLPETSVQEKASDPQAAAIKKIETKLHHLEDKEKLSHKQNKPTPKRRVSPSAKRLAPHIEIIKSANADSTNLHSKLSKALDSLEDLVNEMEYGYTFSTGDGLPQVLKVLDPSWPADLRRKAAIVIGEALSNNQEAQAAAKSYNITATLLGLLSKESNVDVVAQLLYALSSTTRGDHTAHDIFYNDDGFVTLAQVYSKFSDIHVRNKCVTLFTDLLNPDMQADTDAQSNTAQPTHRGLNDWCKALKDTLEMSSQDVYFQLDFMRALIALKEEEAKDKEKFCEQDSSLLAYFDTQTKAAKPRVSSGDENQVKLFELLEQARKLYTE